MGGLNKYLINGHSANEKRVKLLFRSVQLNIKNPHFLIMQGNLNLIHILLFAVLPFSGCVLGSGAPFADRSLARPHHQGFEHEANGISRYDRRGCWYQDVR